MRWHLLSLDAPTVAALWVWFAAWASQVWVPRLLPVLMFGVVWVLYVVDRLLDGRGNESRGPDDVREWRHDFHQRHLRTFLGGAVVATTGLLPLLTILPPRLLVAELLLGFCLVAWFGLVHRTRLSALPKELILGPFFSAGVFLPAVALSDTASDRAGLGYQAVGFAILCSLNALSIRAWEQPEVQVPNRITTLALRWRETGLQALAVISVVLVALTAWHHERAWALWLALGLASMALLLLGHSAAWLGRTTLRAAADAALLTPAVVLLGLALIHRARLGHLALLAGALGLDCR